jgi:hypothetical protein
MFFSGLRSIEGRSIRSLALYRKDIPLTSGSTPNGETPAERLRKKIEKFEGLEELLIIEAIENWARPANCVTQGTWHKKKVKDDDLKLYTTAPSMSHRVFRL